jgi:peptidoglycan/LPS O-acetylase OafA/YrhL
MLRGISAWFVMLAHFSAWITENYSNVGGYNAILKYTLGQLGGIGVLIFFFVSGYGIYISYGNKKVDKKYIVKRLKGVYIPYIIIKVVLLVGYFALGLKDRLTILDITSILLVEDWFIHVIVLQYIIFFVLSKFLNRKYVCWSSLLIDFILSVIFILEEKPIGWFNALWLFTVGMIIAKYEEQIILFFKTNWRLKVLVLTGIFFVTGMVFALYKGAMWANVIKPISGVFLMVAICGIYRKYRLYSKIMDWSGKRSMYLYIIHLNMWEYSVRVNDLVIRMMVSIILTVIITEVLYRIVENIVGKITGQFKWI